MSWVTSKDQPEDKGLSHDWGCRAASPADASHAHWIQNNPTSHTKHGDGVLYVSAAPQVCPIRPNVALVSASAAGSWAPRSDKKVSAVFCSTPSCCLLCRGAARWNRFKWAPIWSPSALLWSRLTGFVSIMKQTSHTDECQLDAFVLQKAWLKTTWNTLVKVQVSIRLILSRGSRRTTTQGRDFIVLERKLVGRNDSVQSVNAIKSRHEKLPLTIMQTNSSQYHQI